MRSRVRASFPAPAGSARVNGVALRAGDGAAIRDEDVVRVEAGEDAELILVDTRE
ncbi:hypothetical protein AA0N74_19390 [Chromobacterium vaccinii]|uniref:pirin family protein n=1 Tax=Chromobacterium vaccinii TaxID=1108595 RepID=UPI0031D738E8